MTPISVHYCESLCMCLGFRASLAWLGPGERMVQRVPKADLAPTETQVPLVLLEKR